MIITERLELWPFDRESASAASAGERGDRRWHRDFPRPDDQGAARAYLRHCDELFGSYFVVPGGSGPVAGLVVGTIGFFGPPDADGMVMVGYGLVEPARGHGYATEALRAVAGHALAQPAVRSLTALTMKDNAGSQRVLEKVGFTRTESTAEAYRYTLPAA